MLLRASQHGRHQGITRLRGLALLRLLAWSFAGQLVLPQAVPASELWVGVTPWHLRSGRGTDVILCTYLTNTTDRPVAVSDTLSGAAGGSWFTIEIRTETGQAVALSSLEWFGKPPTYKCLQPGQTDRLLVNLGEFYAVYGGKRANGTTLLLQPGHYRARVTYAPSPFSDRVAGCPTVAAAVSSEWAQFEVSAQASLFAFGGPGGSTGGKPEGQDRPADHSHATFPIGFEPQADESAFAPFGLESIFVEARFDANPTPNGLRINVRFRNLSAVPIANYELDDNASPGIELSLLDDGGQVLWMGTPSNVRLPPQWPQCIAPGNVSPEFSIDFRWSPRLNTEARHDDGTRELGPLTPGKYRIIARFLFPLPTAAGCEAGDMIATSQTMCFEIRADGQAFPEH